MVTRRARVADVEGVPHRLVALVSASRMRVDDVVDVAPGADLRAVVVHVQRLAACSARTMKWCTAPSPTWRGP